MTLVWGADKLGRIPVAVPLYSKQNSHVPPRVSNPVLLGERAATNRLMALKTKIQRFSSYLRANTACCHYKDESVTALQGNVCCFVIITESI